ncbi:hypothetical protein M948_20745 [Virgibacillus sp. CM-4]|uniref:Helix-turn-helix n=1 Tax=Virgibacillus massiliensis TaxID=1462526 RepID=A0A024QG73_9BACI|nr:MULTISPECIES: helix-turn-helix transcriptional regulator [Virgibacillus]EQB34809.1 hypothetical protein M948_20745 [Virgibacillus sp. CM-4]CDQ41474.1 Helix-turn-helix [Virgibacillus massiliensis]
MELGTTLRRMRRNAGYSQEFFSEKMHMSRSNISKLESNKLDIRGRDLIRWAQETNSQDILIALVCNVDVASAGQMIADTLQSVGTILLGGLI